jgi:hypothetical protein
MARRLVSRLAVILALPTVAGTFQLLAADCRQVQGTIVENQLPPLSCLSSPVLTCTTAIISGSVSGSGLFNAFTLIPAPDLKLPLVFFATGRVVVNNVQFEARRGSLTLATAAVIGNGNIVDNEKIVDGTGDFAGATGSIRISGPFVPNVGGTSTYEGTICFP